jgi:hypothetical protein
VSGRGAKTSKKRKNNNISSSFGYKSSLKTVLIGID